ncbi:hypothetical protein RQX22_18755 [Sphingosinicella sp. GR2756]|uniref:Uncharacterized protein n=2 Tax=Sphingosinicella rhizophila TaxID=3050082 RepID=A0ABU3QC80_9SPHN|nr:hypothetical protein [Sphingosinicella sp. GR2756]
MMSFFRTMDRKRDRSIGDAARLQRRQQQQMQQQLIEQQQQQRSTAPLQPMPKLQAANSLQPVA